MYSVNTRKVSPSLCVGQH